MLHYQKIGIAFAGLAIGVLLAVAVASPLYALDFTVTKTADTNDGSCDSDCSLREAIIAANDADGPDVITLPAGTFTLTISGTNENGGATGDLDITDSLTITGVGPAATIIDGGDLDRVLDINDPLFQGISVHISGVTIQHGQVNDSGGGIFVRSGNNLSLLQSIIFENISTGGDQFGGVERHGCY
jgi:CSLREA domain-containing protein